jgi:hypothetical protein
MKLKHSYRLTDLGKGTLIVPFYMSKKSFGCLLLSTFLTAFITFFKMYALGM